MVTTPQTVRVRKSVLTLGHKGDDLDWYGQAVAKLRARPLQDPTSWRYMAAVHGYPGHAADPFAQAGEKLPSSADQRSFWNQCQHQSWFFLSWHRGYLACFEEIVAAAVVDAGGPSGWALPYWNYSATNAHSSELPAAFRNQHDSNGNPNPLWVAGRNMPTPTTALPPSHVVLDALLHSPFQGTSGGGEPGFGGVKTGFSHFGGTNGRLENLPHNAVHVDVAGLMSDPDTAALDPIFWLHHANIDRLWEVWIHRDPSFVNPVLKSWLSGTSFQLHDAKGKIVKFNSGQMRDTLKVRHGYQYDDISDPFHVPVAAAAAGATGSGVTAGSQQAPQLVAATPAAVPLGNAPTQAQVAFNQAARLAAVASASSRPVRAYLNLENVRGAGAPRNYEVYVDAPKPPTASATDAGRKPLLAGHLSTFGVRKASLPGGKHGGSGITTVIEISNLIEQLHRERNWDGAHLEVTFVPSGPEAASPVGSSGPLEVGRVSVYYG
jgi:tyrosinase